MFLSMKAAGLLRSDKPRWVPFVRIMAAVLCLLAGVFTVLPAQAQGIETLKSKKIPRFDTLSEEQFLKDTVEYREKPYNDAYLDYMIRLPRDWKKGAEEWESIKNPKETGTKETQLLSRRVLGKITKYYGSPRLDATSYLEINALELDYEITTKNWMLHHIYNRGFTLEGLEEINERRVEVLYVLVQDHIPYVVRTVAEINGLRMVLVSYYVPEQYWEEEKAMQEKVVGSFKFTDPEKVRIELTRTYPFLDLLRFDYPASWKLIAPNIYSMDGMDVRLINAFDTVTMNGQIDVHIFSTELDTTLAQEVGFLRDELSESGLNIGKLLEIPDSYKIQSHMTFSRVEVYDAEFDKSKNLFPQEYWLALMAEDRFYYIVTMLTPSRSSDFYIWARNSEAFQMVVETMRP